MEKARRRAARAVVLALTLATGATACGGGQRNSTTPASAAPGTAHGAHSLTQSQLDTAVVDAHDLPGLCAVKLAGAPGTLGEGGVHARSSAGTDPAPCAPVSAALQDGASRYEPVASLVRELSRKRDGVVLTLASYRAADAPRVLDDLRTALQSCTAFRVTQVIEAGKNTLDLPVGVVVLRHGSAVAIIQAIGDPGKSLTIPADIVRAQSRALYAAVRNS